MKRMVHSLFCSLLLCILIACAGTSTAVKPVVDTRLEMGPDRKIFLSISKVDGYGLQGYLDPGSISSAVNRSAVYNDGSAAGALGSLIGQAIANSAEVRKNQALADERRKTIVSQYLETFEGFGFERIKKDFIEKGLVKTASQIQMLDYDKNREKYSAGDYIVLVTPVVFMPENRDTLMSESRIQIYDSSLMQEPIYDNDIKVVSERIETKDALAYWSENDYQQLTLLGESLIHDSLAIATSMVFEKNNEGSKELTHKYWFDGDNRFERGTEYPSRCGLTLLQNLRGNYLAFPSGEVCNELRDSNKQEES